MTNDLTTLIDRLRQNAGSDDAKAPTSEDRQKLLRVAQEFESMMLVQVMKDMRRAGKWDDDDSEEKSGSGAESLFEMADMELAGHLARVQGLGLSKQLLEAFDRMMPQGRSGLNMPQPPVSSDLPVVPMLPIAPTLPDLPVSPAVPSVVPTTTSLVATVSRPGVVEASDSSATVPTVGGHVTSHFGWRRDPFTGQARFHRGVDLAAVYGQDVQAAKSGRVVFSGGQNGYGNTVVVEHADGTRTRYAHLSATLVTAGDQVDTGQAVGRAGHSGRATGTHVHFEVTAADGRPMAPDEWLKQS